MGALCNQLAHQASLSLCILAAYKDNRRGPNRWGRKSVCETEDWRKKSLKVRMFALQGNMRVPEDDPQQNATSWFACRQVVREIPVAGVLDDLQGETKFEASGIAQRGHNSGQYFVVFDK
jgi:hypothetical protein